MALTEWHFILLYEDKVRAIDLLSDKVVYEEALDLVSFAICFLSPLSLCRRFVHSRPTIDRYD